MWLNVVECPSRSDLPLFHSLALHVAVGSTITGECCKTCLKLPAGSFLRLLSIRLQEIRALTSAADDESILNCFWTAEQANASSEESAIPLTSVQMITIEIILNCHAMRADLQLPGGLNVGIDGWLTDWTADTRFQGAIWGSFSLDNTSP